MKRRTYTPIERQKSADAGRERILSAARELLQVDDAEGFSIDAVAGRAGVSRMTVYNQFGSKAGLLEALFDSLAASGPFDEMTAIFGDNDPIGALDKFVTLFGRFWTHSRAPKSSTRSSCCSASRRSTRSPATTGRPATSSRSCKSWYAGLSASQRPGGGRRRGSVVPPPNLITMV